MGRQAAALVTVVLLTGCASGESSASCAAAHADVSPRTAAVGDDLLVTGSYFSEGPCNDGGSGGWTAWFEPEQDGPAPASQDVPVTLEQDGRTWPLGSVDAGEGTYELRLTVRVPDGVQPGRARVRVGPRAVRVTVAAR